MYSTAAFVAEWNMSTTHSDHSYFTVLNDFCFYDYHRAFQKMDNFQSVRFGHKKYYYFTLSYRTWNN